MSDLPVAAITAAAEAIRSKAFALQTTRWADTLARVALEAAAPLIAAAERDRILVPDETLHADGSIGPGSVPAEYSQDPAYWYRRWLFVMKQLDKEASERISAYAGMQKRLDEVVAVAAAAAERENIIQLATQMRASIPADHPEGAQASFADYLRVTTPQSAGTDAP